MDEESNLKAMPIAEASVGNNIRVINQSCCTPACCAIACCIVCIVLISIVVILAVSLGNRDQ